MIPKIRNGIRSIGKRERIAAKLQQRTADEFEAAPERDEQDYLRLQMVAGACRRSEWRAQLLDSVREMGLLPPVSEATSPPPALGEPASTAAMIDAPAISPPTRLPDSPPDSPLQALPRPPAAALESYNRRFPLEALQALKRHEQIDSLDAPDWQVESAIAAVYGCRRADLCEGRFKVDAAKIAAILQAKAAETADANARCRV
jgi:hypothetical protein